MAEVLSPDQRTRLASAAPFRDLRHSPAIARQGYERAISALSEWWTAEGT